MRFYYVDRFMVRDWLYTAAPVLAIVLSGASAWIAARHYLHPATPPFPLVCTCTDHSSCTVEANAFLPKHSLFSQAQVRTKDGSVYLATCHSGEVALRVPDSKQMTMQPAGMHSL